MPEPSLNEIMRTLTRMETTLESIAEGAKDHETRLRKLEGRGGTRWDALTLSLLTSAVVGIVGYFIGKQ